MDAECVRTLFWHLSSFRIISLPIDNVQQFQKYNLEENPQQRINARDVSFLAHSFPAVYHSYCFSISIFFCYSAVLRPLCLSCCAAHCIVLLLAYLWGVFGHGKETLGCSLCLLGFLVGKA